MRLGPSLFNCAFPRIWGILGSGSDRRKPSYWRQYVELPHCGRRGDWRFVGFDLESSLIESYFDEGSIPDVYLVNRHSISCPLYLIGAGWDTNKGFWTLEFPYL